MNYSSTWVIFRNKKLYNGLSSTEGQTSMGRQSTQELRKLQLQCKLICLIRVEAHDRLKFLEALLDRCFIHANSRCGTSSPVDVPCAWLPWTLNLRMRTGEPLQTQRIAHRSHWSFLENQCWPTWEGNNKSSFFSSQKNLINSKRL